MTQAEKVRRRRFLQYLGLGGLGGAFGTELFERLTPYGLQKQYDEARQETGTLTRQLGESQQQIDTLTEKLKKTAFHDEIGVSDYHVAVGYNTFWNVYWEYSPAGRWKEQGVTDHPILGEYNSSDQSIIDYHLNWALRSGIRSLILEFGWIRPNSPFDIVARESLLKSSLISHMDFSVFYLYQWDYLEKMDQELFFDDFSFLANHYFNHPSCLRVGNRVMVSIANLPLYWNNLGVNGTNAQFRELKRRTTDEFGYDLFLVADVWANSASSAGFFFDPSFLDNSELPFDALTIWGNLWDSLGTNVATYGDYVTKYAGLWRRLSSMAKKHGLYFVPWINAGFDDKPVATYFGREHHYIARDPEWFSKFLEAAKEETTPPLNMINLYTWNDFHEATDVEPTGEYGFTYLDMIRKAFVKNYVIEK